MIASNPQSAAVRMLRVSGLGLIALAMWMTWLICQWALHTARQFDAVRVTWWIALELAVLIGGFLTVVAVAASGASLIRRPCKLAVAFLAVGLSLLAFFGLISFGFYFVDPTWFVPEARRPLSSIAFDVGLACTLLGACVLYHVIAKSAGLSAENDHLWTHAHIRTACGLISLFAFFSAIPLGNLVAATILEIDLQSTDQGMALLAWTLGCLLFYKTAPPLIAKLTRVYDPGIDRKPWKKSRP